MLNLSNLRRIWIAVLVATLAMLAFAVASTHGSAHVAGSSKKSVAVDGPVSTLAQHLKLPPLHTKSLHGVILEHHPQTN